MKGNSPYAPLMPTSIVEMNLIHLGFPPECFHIPYVVENFPMKARTEEELQQLNRVLQQKKTEAECLKVPL